MDCEAATVLMVPRRGVGPAEFEREALAALLAALTRRRFLYVGRNASSSDSCVRWDVLRVQDTRQ